MTPTDLRIAFTFDTGDYAIQKVDPKNRHKYLSDNYVKWLEGKNNKMREIFHKETGIYAMQIDSHTNELSYKDSYKTWLEEKRLQLCNAIKTFNS